MIGAFKQQASLGMHYNASAQVVIFGGYLYRFGGQAAVGGAVQASDNFIQSAKILEDGSLGLFSVVGTGLPAWSSPMSVQLGDLFFMIGGGAAGSAFNDVLRYKLELGGTVSGPVRCAKIQLPVSGLRGSCQIEDYCYFMGTSGAGANSVDVWCFQITADGVNGLRRIDDFQVGPLASRTLIGHRGFIYSVGGIVTSGGVRVNDVWAAKANGYSVGPWKLIGSIPVALSQIPILMVDDYMVTMGGRNASVNPQATNAVYVAKVGLGTIGPWSLVSSLVTPVFSGQGTVAASPRHIYLPGGSSDTLVNQNVVQYAPILRGP